MTVKEGDNRQSGDFKGKDKDDASLPLRKSLALDEYRWK